MKQLTNKPPTANSKGLRFGNFVQGREVIEEEIEAVLTGKKDAEGRARRGRDAAATRSCASSRPRTRAERSRSGRGRAAPLPPRAPWKNASSSSPSGCRTRCSRRRSRSRSCSSSGPRRRRCTTRSCCRTPFGLSIAVRLVPELHRPLQGHALPRVLQGHGDLQRARRRLRARRSRCSSPPPPTAWSAARSAYKTLLIWPYAVAPADRRACSGRSSSRRRSASSPYVLKQLGRGLELDHQRQPGDAADRDRRRVEADQLQLPLLPRRPAVDPALADGGRGDRRRDAPRGASGRSSSRCSRPRRSSCWW